MTMHRSLCMRPNAFVLLCGLHEVKQSQPATMVRQTALAGYHTLNNSTILLLGFRIVGSTWFTTKTLRVQAKMQESGLPNVRVLILKSMVVHESTITSSYTEQIMN